MADARVQNQGYRGRVRSGCLTCRRRKVRCGEEKPVCQNCSRLQRQCVYKPRKAQATSAEAAGAAGTTGAAAPAAQSTAADLGDQPTQHHRHHHHHRADAHPSLPSPPIPSSLSSPGSSIASVGGDVSAVPASSFSPSPLSSAPSPVAFSLASAFRVHGDRGDPILPLGTFLQHDGIGFDDGDDDGTEGGGAHASPATFISRDIHLTTTMDLLTARREDTQLTAFFVDHVDCPGITPFDDVNWPRAKRCFAALGRSRPAVALAVAAVALVCKATLYTLPVSRAVAHYDAARRSLDALIRENDGKIQDGDTNGDTNADADANTAVLVVVFLLCVFKLIHADEEAEPALKNPSQLLLDRLKQLAAAMHGPQLQPQRPAYTLSMRLVAWLKILQAMTMRGGGNGLLGAAICRLLPNYEGPIPNIADDTSWPVEDPPEGSSSAATTPNNNYNNNNNNSNSNTPTTAAAPPPAVAAPAGARDRCCPPPPDLGTHLYEVLSAPLFDFYLRLQLLSGEIATLTHYHRPRTTATDQDEVVARVAHTKARLHALWDGRPAMLMQTAEAMRAQLAPAVARRMTSLAGVCKAAFYAEFIELDRVVGDPVTKWTDSCGAITAIRDIVDYDDRPAQDSHEGGAGGSGSGSGSAGARGGRRLNPGYIRALFLCAIESMDEEQNQWAVARLADIQNPVYRSAFFSAFAKALSDAQMAKERRVTSRYFCIWHFGVPPPYL
ncbi:Zn(2)-C6 fungal-type DNA-binding domain protein [Niveomyces insectorum RCEF 264]|uniref:Zn(2)-C6 fungal-type DNA-binding domain protein n=1 Tax=Niveomyces insectorum RCEF 264 TaxID=1081102 RepID=A0A162IKY5_9HYPO|nr:Zn(2)-C6 fungal-type DNA-binding domain protein [Niveomyces insectorum RCEF 264]